jgi:electron transfer flavoprotein alpha subunit
VTAAEPGETVLVHGASGAVGVSLLQQAALLGVRVVGTCSRRRFDEVRRFGGEPVPYGAGLEGRVREAARDGIVAALDCVGTDEAVDVSLAMVSERARVVTIAAKQRGADVDIEGADVLIAGGRGLGKAEGFELVEALAKAFGGNSAVAATRAVVDAGWYPYAAQIGQTGKTVAPKLYLAAGVSGAIQHKVGMQNSENILAINKDQNAPIFEFSDLGVVGDLHKILPKLTEAIKAKKGG